MAIDEAKFFAWLDGELDAAEAAEVEAAVAADPVLAAQAQQHRALCARLHKAFDPVAAAPVPNRLRDSIQPRRSGAIDLGARRRSPRGAWSPLPQWAAMAATLVVGVLVGTMVDGGRAASPIEIRDGKMYAAAQLDDALDRQLAGAGGTGPLRIGLTFRDQSGSVCRSFTGEGSAGLACRDGDEWRLRGLFAAPEGQSGDYRMAAGTDPNLAALVDSTIGGDAFDAEQERSARDRGWR